MGCAAIVWGSGQVVRGGVLGLRHAFSMDWLAADWLRRLAAAGLRVVPPLNQLSGGSQVFRRWKSDTQSWHAVSRVAQKTRRLSGQGVPVTEQSSSSARGGRGGRLGRRRTVVVTVVALLVVAGAT